MLKAADSTQVPDAKAILGAGYQAWGVYLRPDRLTLHQVHDLKAHGVKIFAVHEKGNPTSAAYFTAAQAQIDGAYIVEQAKAFEVPPGYPVFVAVDYDASPADMTTIKAYFVLLREIVRPAGWLVSVYGSGFVCETLVQEGLAHHGFKAQSHGWGGYDWDGAAIVQGPSLAVLGVDADSDTVLDVSAVF